MTDTSGGAARTLTILVVDDHEVVRQGLSAMLDRRPGFQVVAEAGTVAEAVEAARRFEPGPGRDGRPAPGRVRDRGLPRHPGRAARHPGRHADQLSRRGGRARGDHRRARAAISSSRSGRATSWPRSRRSVAANRCSTRPSPARSSSGCDGSPASDQPDELAALTQQERKILALVAEGMTNKEIATEVFLSDKTVKNYVSSILAKLNLERRAQAAAYVARLKGHAQPAAATPNVPGGSRQSESAPRSSKPGSR